MKRKIKILGGKVHGVGYRPWLTDAAIDSGLQGFYAINRIEKRRPAVIVLAEGDEDSILQFEGLVKGSRPQYAEVDRIDVEDYGGDVMPLDRYATMNTSSQMNKAIPLLLSMNDKMDQMLDKQDETINGIQGLGTKMDQMLDKQDETINGIQGLGTKMDQMLDKQDETIGEIRDLREDLARRSNSDRLARMEKDIRAIKSKVGIR